MTRLCIFIATLLAIAGCESNDSPPPVVGTLERDRIELIAEAQEPIIEIPVTEGQMVDAGQLLMRLDGSLQQSRIRKAQAEMREAQARLAELERGPRPEVLREARARLEGAGQDYQVKERELKRAEELVEKSLLSPSELDLALSHRELARASMKQARASLDALEAGTTVEELDQARGRVQAMAAAVDSLQISASRLDILAPVSGTIDAISYELGERPAAGKTVLVLLSGEPVFARVYVPQSLRAKITPGTSAHVHLDGIDQPAEARVRWVASEATFTPYFALTQKDRSRLSYLAEVVLSDQRASLWPSGMPVQVSFPDLQ
jgi:HlyD family secretion protein